MKEAIYAGSRLSKFFGFVSFLGLFSAVIAFDSFTVGSSRHDIYADKILEVTATEEVHNRIQAALAMLGDLKNLLSVTEDLAQMHLSGKPKDVFHSEEEYLKLAQARYH